MQLVLSPVVTNAAEVLETRGAIPKSEPPIDSNSSLLRVSYSAGREMVTTGEFVSYELTVTNMSGFAAMSDVQILDILPEGFSFKNGSVQLNGASRPDPVLSANGQTLNFSVGNLAAKDSATIRFVAEVTAGSKLGKAVSYASAIRYGGENSKIVTAAVLVRDNPQATQWDQPKTPPAADAAGDTTSASTTLQPLTVKNSDVKPPAVETTATTSPTAPTSDNAATPVPNSTTQSKTPNTPNTEKSQAAGRISGASVESETQNLAKLIGKSDIPVLADADGLFVKILAENLIDINEPASLVGDTNLSESIRIGRNFSRDNLVANARTDQAKAQTLQAMALLLPSVSVHVNSGLEISDPSVATDVNGRPISSDAHSRTDASLTIRQPLFDLPSFRDWSRRKVVEQAREENYRTSDGDAYISLVNAYLSLVSTRLQTDMTQEFEAQLNELFIYVEKRAKAGAASNSDMARVSARSQATLSSRLEQESAHAAAGIEFIRLTNLVPKKVRLPALEDVDIKLLPKTLDMAVATALQSNPEITALKAELQAAGMDQSAAKDRYLPRIDAEYTYGYALHAEGSTSSNGQRDHRIMAVLNWNLFNGGSDYYSHVERTARVKELQYRLDDQRRRVVQTLSANYATLATTRERIVSGYQELKSISTAAEAMSKRMLSGNQSLLDLLDVYDRLYQVRSRLVSLHILELSTVTQLVRLTLGTPGVVSEITSAAPVSNMSKGPTVPLAMN